MSQPGKRASVHFQILVAGTLLFLAIFCSVAVRLNGPISDNSIALGLWSIAGYLAFVVLVASHGLFVRKRPTEDEDELFDSPPNSNKTN
jgi:hypothetical protein